MLAIGVNDQASNALVLLVAVQLGGEMTKDLETPPNLIGGLLVLTHLLDSPTAWRQEYAHTYLRRLSMHYFKLPGAKALKLSKRWVCLKGG